MKLSHVIMVDQDKTIEIYMIPYIKLYTLPETNVTPEN